MSKHSQRLPNLRLRWLVLRICVGVLQNVQRRTFMSDPVSFPLPRLRSYQLIRKKRLLQKIPFSKSTLHAKLDPKSPYFDNTLPRPIYFPGSRIPYWDEATVDAWIATCAGQQIVLPQAAEVPAAQELAEPRTMHLPMRMADGSHRSIAVEMRKPRHRGEISHSAAN